MCIYIFICTTMCIGACICTRVLTHAYVLIDSECTKTMLKCSAYSAGVKEIPKAISKKCSRALHIPPVSDDAQVLCIFRRC